MTETVRRTVMITGTSGDVGSYLARHFLGRGWAVLGVDRVAAVEPPPGLVFGLCDLTDSAQTAAVIGELAAASGPVNALVNCAGKIANAPLVSLGSDGWHAHDPSLWAEVIASNLTTAFHATASVVKTMLASRQKGVIINISSVCARGNPGQVAYSAAKAGLNGLTLALAKELGPVGIRVVGLAPGYFDTPSTRANVQEARLAKVANAVPLKRLGSLDDLCHAVEFIIDNPYLNGTIVELDGGLVV